MKTYTQQEQEIMIHNDLHMDFKREYAGRMIKNDWTCDRYLITLRNINTHKIFQFDFFVGTGWIEQRKRPLPFDVLSSIRLDNPHGLSFENWCAEYDYDTDSRKVYKTYEACCEQTDKFKAVFPDIDLDIYPPLEDY